MSGPLFYQLVLSALVTAVDLFIIHRNGLSSASVVACVSIITLMVPTFFYCKLSESITSHLLEIGDGFFESAWYELPMSQQKLFLMPIKRAQCEIRWMGFYIIYCSLPTFLSVSGY